MNSPFHGVKESERQIRLVSPFYQRQIAALDFAPQRLVVRDPWKCLLQPHAHAVDSDAVERQPPLAEFERGGVIAGLECLLSERRNIARLGVVRSERLQNPVCGQGNLLTLVRGARDQARVLGVGLGLEGVESVAVHGDRITGDGRAVNSDC